MAVSLKKREAVDLSKAEIPPKVREYTPVHLIDEEETIIRHSRQPPIQPQHFTESNRCPIDNEIDVKSNDEDLENERKRLKGLRRKYQYPLLISIASSCLIVLVFLLIRTFSPIGSIPVESVPNENVSDVVTSSVTSVESVPSGDNYPVYGSFFELFGDFFSFVFHSPACLFSLGLGALFVFIRLVQNIVKMGR